MPNQRKIAWDSDLVETMASDAAAVVAALERDPMQVATLEAAVALGATFTEEQVFRALSAMAETIATAEAWCRVGMLRAARYMVGGGKRCAAVFSLYCPHLRIVYLLAEFRRRCRLLYP